MKTLHRIITPIIAVLSVPAAIFLPFFRVMVAQGTGTNDDGGKVNLLDSWGLSEYISLKDLFTFIKDGATEGTGLIADIIKSLTENGTLKISEIIPSIHWGVIFLVLLAVCALLILAIIIVAPATGKPGISAWLSAIGVICAFAMNASFDAFAKPIIAGALNIGSLLSSVLGDSLGQLGNLGGGLLSALGLSYSIDCFQLSTVYAAILSIFITIFIFSAAATFSEDKKKR